MMSKTTAVPSSPSGRVISIGWMACPASLALLSMCAISFLVLVVVGCSPWGRPTLDTPVPWPQAPTSRPMRSVPLAGPMPLGDGQLRCRQGPCAELGCAYLAGNSGQLGRLAQSLFGLLLAVLGQLLQLSTLGLAAVPVGVGMLLPGPPVTAPALPGVRRLCQRHRPPRLGRLVRRRGPHGWLSGVMAGRPATHPPPPPTLFHP